MDVDSARFPHRHCYLRVEVPRRKPGDIFVELTTAGREGLIERHLAAVVYRESEDSRHQLTFIFWIYSSRSLYMLCLWCRHQYRHRAPTGLGNVNYNEFFLAGILAMASLPRLQILPGRFFLDRDNGIFLRDAHLSMSAANTCSGKSFQCPHLMVGRSLLWSAVSF